jgi:outer membrane protein assembly factor BamB
MRDVTLPAMTMRVTTTASAVTVAREREGAMRDVLWGTVRTVAIAAILLLLLYQPAEARQWPEFRGPTGQGHSEERGIPLEWSETRNVRWKVPVPGSGWSSPVIADGRVWMTTAVQGAGTRKSAISLRALAYDMSTGRELVNIEVFRIDRPGAINGKNSRASPTPILDGDRVYVHYGADGTAALSTAGDVLWRAHLSYDSQHGNGGSPALYRDLLIVNCDGNGGDAFVAALDTRTGKTRWRTERRLPADQAYSTPLIVRVGEQDQVVSVGAFRTAAYDPANGKELWRVSYGDGFSNVPRPVAGNGVVYIATGFQQPALIAVRADGRGDVTNSHIAWTLRRAAPYTPSPILVGTELYMVNDGGIASCLDAATGAARWQHRLNGTFSASPIAADGRIYFLSEDGVTTVIAPGTVYRELAVNELDGATLASMAVADRSIFVRSATHLYRISESK